MEDFMHPDSKVSNVIDRALTVEDLIAELQNYDPNTPVVFMSDYGDYTHTMQALTVTEVEEIEGNRLDDSAYSKSGVSIRDEFSEFDPKHDEDDCSTVIVLS